MLRILITGVALFCASSAYANNNGGASSTFPDLKQKCTDFIGNPQMKTITAKLYCNETSYFWRAGEPVDSSLKNLREVGARLELKTLSTPHQTWPAAIDDTAIQCQSFQKIKREVLPVEVELKCEELVLIEDLAAYCDDVIAQRAKQDPGMVVETPTSEVITFCPNSSKG